MKHHQDDRSKINNMHQNNHTRVSWRYPRSHEEKHDIRQPHTMQTQQ